jgi:hypothetical protein
VLLTCAMANARALLCSSKSAGLVRNREGTKGRE